MGVKAQPHGARTPTDARVGSPKASKAKMKLKAAPGVLGQKKPCLTPSKRRRHDSLDREAAEAVEAIRGRPALSALPSTPLPVPGAAAAADAVCASSAACGAAAAMAGAVGIEAISSAEGEAEGEGWPRPAAGMLGAAAAGT